MKADQKKKIRDMIPSMRSLDEFKSFLEIAGFDYFIRPISSSSPRDTKKKVYVKVYDYWDRCYRQIWVVLDSDFAMKALVLGFIPDIEKALERITKERMIAEEVIRKHAEGFFEEFESLG